MSDTLDDELRARLTIALSEVTRAEGVLSTTLRNLGSGAARAAKVAMTADVKEAFAGLHRAHEVLSEVRELLEKE